MRSCVLVAAAVSVSCGPKPMPPQRPCAESVQARAEGFYVEHPDRGGSFAYDVHAGSCYRSCDAGDGDACMEYRLLSISRFWPNGIELHEVDLVEADCAAGYAPSCGWLDEADHREQIASWRKAAEPYRGGYVDTESDATPIARAADALTSEASSMGGTLVAAATYSMEGTSDISFRTDALTLGRSYGIALVAERAMSFTAQVRGSAASFDLGAVERGDDVYVRSVTFQWNDEDRADAEVAIHADGSERGDVRYLLFDLGD